MLVGYSGGADSTCLLHLLSSLGVDVIAAHLHHGQREEAEKEMALCQAFAEEIGVPFVSGRADVPLMARDLRVGLEEAGRHARYAFLSQAGYRLECELIATAHTRSDQVETVILNIARGSGLSGLAGIPEQRDNVVRPLLPFTRAETRKYCDDHGFWTHDDPSNSDLNFSRARVRHRILPELAAINPSADLAIVRLGETASQEDRFLNGMAAAALEQSELPINGDLKFLTESVEASFDRAKLTHLPPVLLKRAVRLAIEALGANLDYDQTQSVVDGLAGQTKGSITAVGGKVVLEWNSSSISTRLIQPTVPFRYSLTVPGETISDEFGWQFTAYEAANDATPARRAALEVHLDPQKVRGSLYFRTAKSGDTMQPLGFEGRRKLTDILSDAKLTAAAKSRLPIVCDLTGPVWAPGVCLDERVRKNETTPNVLVLRFERVKE